MVCLTFIFARIDLFFTQLILLLLLIFQVYNLVRFVAQTNRDLSKFLLAIRHKDYSTNFVNQQHLFSSFQELQHGFQDIIHTFKKVEAQKESQYQYFKLIVEHVNVGIITLNEKNEIVLKNKAVTQLLQVPDISSWTILQAKRPAFTQSVELLSREGSRLVEVPVESETRQFSLEVNHVKLLGEPFRIITFQDINTEIEQKEMEAWHKLIRILTHEIMNSVTPVVSLTETMLMILEEENGNQKQLPEITEENISDIRFSLKTIQKRSGGMLRFLDDYRKLTRIPVPQMESLLINDLFESVARLMQGEFQKQAVKLSIQCSEPGLSIEADGKLIEQVLINLLTNSLQSLEGIYSPIIELNAYQKDNRTIIEVSDNGKGIDADKLDKIFIPFYSTKADGSGIGLSVSKQIMHLHGGSIKVFSQKGVKTSFQLHFPTKIK
jgi:nitrogen fixation/metabolism regulation signal transduction histidine kinase